MGDAERAAIVLIKVFAVVLLVLGPLTFVTVIVHGLKAMHTVNELTHKQWAFGLSFGLGISYLGIYLCRREFGWFGGRNQN